MLIIWGWNKQTNKQTPQLQLTLKPCKCLKALSSHCNVRQRRSFTATTKTSCDRHTDHASLGRLPWSGSRRLWRLHKPPPLFPWPGARLWFHNSWKTTGGREENVKKCDFTNGIFNRKKRTLRSRRPSRTGPESEGADMLLVMIIWTYV